MKNMFLPLLTGLFSLIAITSSYGALYSASYGDRNNPAILFLHGGPGYNSYSFEMSTAQKLADAGYYVIVFDQRGCGRSKEVANSNYSFEEAFADIDSIYEKYNLEEASIIGHSWGGTLGLMYSNEYPFKVRNLILTDSPLSYQKTFKTIIAKCRKIYTEQKSEQLQYLDMLEKMDTSSLEYSSYCFMHAMSCGLYQAKNQTPEATELYAELKQDKQASLLSDLTRAPVAGFYENEKYTTLDLTDKIKAFKEKVAVFGIYGADDGLFDQAHLDSLRALIGEEKFVTVDNASHSVFIDQQEKFISLIEEFESK